MALANVMRVGQPLLHALYDISGSGAREIETFSWKESPTALGPGGEYLVIHKAGHQGITVRRTRGSRKVEDALNDVPEAHPSIRCEAFSPSERYYAKVLGETLLVLDLRKGVRLKTATVGNRLASAENRRLCFLSERRIAVFAGSAAEVFDIVQAP